MHHYIARRLVAALPTLLGAATVVFLLVRLLPGDPARVIAGLLATEDDVERIRRGLGLDQPLPVQYVLFLGRLLQGNLGVSARTSLPVTDELLARFPNTVQLATVSIVLAMIVGITAGVISARNHGSIVDYLVSALTLVGVSMPVYWLGLMLIIVFAVNLRLFPASGSDQPSSVVLPSITLASFSVALIARMTRSSMLEVLRQDYIRTARAKGLREQMVVSRHALKNALLPILTVIGLQFGTLLGGAVLTETVFGWPGVGQLLVESIFARDYPVVQGIVLTIAVMFILVNLIVDLLYAYADPRIRYN